MKPEPVLRSPQVDDYINGQRPEVSARLTALRTLIHELIPGVTEKMGYGIPTFQWAGRNLVHIGAAAGHLGFYPGPDAIVAFEEELADFKTSRGTVQIPHDRALPVDLLTRMLLHLKAEAQAREAARTTGGRKKAGKPATNRPDDPSPQPAETKLEDPADPT